MVVNLGDQELPTSSDIYLDGSLLDGRIRISKRGGWSWLILLEVEFNEVPPALARAGRGSLLGWHQTSPRAEYYALFDVVEEAKKAVVPPFVFIVHHEGII